MATLLTTRHNIARAEPEPATKCGKCGNVLVQYSNGYKTTRPPLAWERDGIINEECFLDEPNHFCKSTEKAPAPPEETIDTTEPAPPIPLERKATIKYSVIEKSHRTEEFRKAWLDPRIPTKKIASDLNLSESAVYNTAKRLGLPSSRKEILGKPTLSPERRKAILRIVWTDPDWRITDITYELRTHSSQLHRWAREMGLPPRPKRINRHTFRAKPLSEEQIQEMIEKHEGG